MAPVATICSVRATGSGSSHCRSANAKPARIDITSGFFTRLRTESASTLRTEPLVLSASTSESGIVMRFSTSIDSASAAPATGPNSCIAMG